MKKDNIHFIETLFSKELIDKRVSEAAGEILKKFTGKNTLIIAVLKGSFVFCADLIRKLDHTFTVDFISLSSYSGSISEGKVKILSKFNENIEGKDIIIVEDIADSGITLDFLYQELAGKNPKSISACVLLDKKCSRKKDIKVDFACFEVSEGFLVGYGLDYNGLYRGLPYIGILKEIKK